MLQKTRCPDIDLLKLLCNDSSLSNRDIGKKFGVGTTLLHRWIKENNINRVSLRNNEGKKPSKEELEKLYLIEQKGTTDIQHLYGVSARTVNNWLQSYNIPIRSKSKSRQTQSYKNKIETTCLERYGVSCPLYLVDNSSNEETNFRNKLNELGFNFEQGKLRVGHNLEIDGYDEERQIAFEYCGLYWHNEKVHPSKWYHYQKFKLCNDLGIRLFTIFSDEWKQMPDKVLKYIYMNAGMAKETVYARKTKLVDLDIAKAKQFLDTHHLQGSTPNIKMALGLEYDNKLLSVMTFGLHHRNSSQMIMNRYAGIHDVRVIGGASKLMNAGYTRIQKPIVTWSDNRWSNGNVYEKMGCKLDANLPPDYSWCTGDYRYSKQSRMKSITGQPKELTEKEYNESLGYSKIWDCGKKRWIYDK